MQGHGTGQSSIIKYNLNRSLLVHHKTAKVLSIVSKTEPSQEVKMRRPACAEHRLPLLKKARKIFQDFEKIMSHQRVLELLEPNFPIMPPYLRKRKSGKMMDSKRSAKGRH